MVLSKHLKPASVLAACLLALSGLAQAQINPFGRDYSQLSAEDLRLLENEANVLLQTGRIGSVSSWRNEKTGTFGTMELEQIFQTNGVPCRRLDHVIKVKGQQDPRLFRLTYCRIGNEWKIAN